MRTLLRIDASVRKANSHSRALGDHFQSGWMKANPGGKIVFRDLAAADIPHLNNSTVAAFTGQDGHEAASTSLLLSDTLIAELHAADEVLVCSPLYNFNAPSTLKAYVDHVIRFGHTFSANESGFHGLLTGKSVCMVTARGGAGPDQLDCQGVFLEAAFRFMGFDRAEWFSLEGTVGDEEQRNLRTARVQKQIDDWFASLASSVASDGIDWRGVFSAQDRAEINALRSAQMNAITAGDAAAYSNLCTDDIVLMLQGRDPASGKEQFFRCESSLFQSAKFVAMQQFPLRVERQGNLVIEIGTSEVKMEGSTDEARHFSARRKYTHVLRRTSAGWRFAVLISNSNV